MPTSSPDPPNSDRFNLQRFVDAQRPVYAQVLAELRAGRKRSHWMWFIFPQIRGLGSSPLAREYAIASLDEARAYLAHPVLGPRLIECTALVNQIADRNPSTTVDDIFGYPDNLKFHSSMTLFTHTSAASSATQPNAFQQALQRLFAGQQDQATLDRV